LWFNKGAEDAGKFYADTFPNSEVTNVFRAPSDFPDGKKGDVLTVVFTEGPVGLSLAAARGSDGVLLDLVAGPLAALQAPGAG
jgi:predicted 3-demethylubiquinone-9 3-methyltransferase (glyoxalase superfamily)